MISKSFHYISPLNICRKVTFECSNKFSLQEFQTICKKLSKEEVSLYIIIFLHVGRVPTREEFILVRCRWSLSWQFCWTSLLAQGGWRWVGAGFYEIYAKLNRKQNMKHVGGIVLIECTFKCENCKSVPCMLCSLSDKSELCWGCDNLLCE